jgi:hypothetical protein
MIRLHAHRGADTSCGTVDCWKFERTSARAFAYAGAPNGQLLTTRCQRREHGVGMIQPENAPECER